MLPEYYIWTNLRKNLFWFWRDRYTDTIVRNNMIKNRMLLFPLLCPCTLCLHSILNTSSAVGKSTYADVSQLRATYKVYTAVYVIAHAIQDMLSCLPGRGPFINGQCPDVKKLDPSEVHELSVLCYIMLWNTYINCLNVTCTLPLKQRHIH